MKSFFKNKLLGHGITYFNSKLSRKNTFERQDSLQNIKEDFGGN